MKVIRQDRQAGEIGMRPESPDDLWHLYNIIDSGDVVIASTYRRDESAKADKIRAERAEKKRMTLGISAEKIEFVEADARLKILGTIVEGPQDVGEHHSLLLEPGETLTVRKTKWSQAALERVKRSVDDSGKPRLLFVSIEADEAVVAVATQYGVKELARIYAPSSGKMYEQKAGGDFYGEVIEKVEQAAEPGMPLVLLGPGFAKESLLAKGKEKRPDLFKGAMIHHTGQAGLQGVHELMKAGMGAEAIKQSRLSLETSLVERALEEIAKGGPVAYGPKEVSDAVDAGAVETLLVLDKRVREAGVSRMMSDVEASRGRAVVISEHFEAGKKLEAIGGLAAMLRYRLP